MSGNPTNNNHACIFGVAITSSGDIEDIKCGEFNAEQADDLAARLILLASRIRNAAASAQADFFDARD